MSEVADTSLQALQEKLEDGSCETDREKCKEELLEHGVRHLDYDIVCSGCRGSGLEEATFKTDDGFEQRVLCSTCTVDDPTITSVWMEAEILPSEDVKIRDAKERIGRGKEE